MAVMSYDEWFAKHPLAMDPIGSYTAYRQSELAKEAKQQQPDYAENLNAMLGGMRQASGQTGSGNRDSIPDTPAAGPNIGYHFGNDGGSGNGLSGGSSGNAFAGWTVTTTHPSDAGQQASQNLASLLNDANQANEDRYKQLLELSDYFGQSALQQNQQRTANDIGATQQSNISRGIDNTTLAPTNVAMAKRTGQQRQNQIQAAMAANKASIIGGRTDQGPNLGLYAQLLSQPR